MKTLESAPTHATRPYRVYVRQFGEPEIHHYVAAAVSPEDATAQACRALGVPVSAAYSSLPCMPLKPAARVKPGKMSSGTTGFTLPDGSWQCTGSRMGRHSDAAQPAPVRFYLRRERLDSGGYDSGGAYWGIGAPLYFAQSEDGELEHWTRGGNRREAKDSVAVKFPGATFFR